MIKTLTKNFKWIEEINIDEKDINIIKSEIWKVESKVFKNDFEIAVDCRKILELLFKIQNKNVMPLNKEIEHFCRSQDVPAEPFSALKAIQKVGNEHAHWTNKSSKWQIFNQASALQLIKSTYDASIVLLESFGLLDEKYITNHLFDFRIYCNDDVKENEIQKTYDSAISANAYKGISVGLLEYVLDSENKFYIPHYQREYIWNKDDINALFSDLKNRLKDGTTHHMGVIAISKRGDDIIRVIDGQQRITTMLLITKAYKEIFDEEGIVFKNNKFKNWEENMNSKYNNVSGKTFDSIRYILRKSGNIKLEKSKSTPVDINYEQIKSEIRGLKKDFSLQEQWNCLKTNFIITPISHNPQKSKKELEVFENLNSKGTPLKETDLIKNYQINSIRETDLDKESEIRDLLDEYIKNVYINKKPKTNKHSLDKFYEFYNNFIFYVDEKGVEKAANVKKHKIYSRFKSHWKENKNLSIKEFEEKLMNISKYLSIWLFLVNGEYNKDSDFKNTKHYLNTLSNKDVHYPLVAFLLDKIYLYNQKNNKFKSKGKTIIFEKCLHILEIYLVRLVGPGTGQSLGPVFNAAISKLKDATIKDYPTKLWQYFTNCSSPMPSKDIFQKEIQSTKFKSWAQKSILISLERYIINSENKHKNQNISISISEIEIEHILSKKPVEKTFPNYMEIIEMIGNKAILDKSTNAKIKNKSFREKQMAYPKIGIMQLSGVKHKEYCITAINKYSKFTEAEIEKRSKEIAKAAANGPFDDFGR